MRFYMREFMNCPNDFEDTKILGIPWEKNQCAKNLPCAEHGSYHKINVGIFQEYIPIMEYILFPNISPLFPIFGHIYSHTYPYIPDVTGDSHWLSGMPRGPTVASAEEVSAVYIDMLNRRFGAADWFHVFFPTQNGINWQQHSKN